MNGAPLMARAVRWFASRTWTALPGLAALLGFGAAACTPHIGNSCNLNTDCSIDNSRQCDNSQSGGYCTVFNCGPNTCPDNATCIEFQASVPGCPYDDYASPSRSGRSFCMKKCGQDSDCRQDNGYQCLGVQDFGGAGVSAIILDSNQSKVCAIPPDPVNASQPGVPAVCPGGTAPDAGTLPAFDSGTPATEGGGDAAADAADGADATGPSPDASADAGAESGEDAAGDASEDATLTDGADAADAGGG